MVVFIKIVQLLLCLSILVIVHEFGHFIAAKIFKVRVEKFYLFFNPKFSILRAKKIKGKWQFKFFSKNVINERPKHDEDGNILTDSKGRVIYEPTPIKELSDDNWGKYPETTEWGIGWVPLGGYVKIAGMIDESMDTEQLKQDPQKHEFRSKPAWQRLIIMLAGVIMNVIAAMVIYIGLLFTYGEMYLPTENVKYGITVDSLGYEMGLRNGDRILSIDNEEVESFYKIPEVILLEQASTIQVLRDGEKVDIALPQETIGKLVSAKEFFMSPRVPFIVGAFAEDSPAKEAGLETNDRIIGINDQYFDFFDEYRPELQKHKNQDITLNVVRSNDTIDINMFLPENALLGVYITSAGVFDFAEKEYSFFQAIPAGCAKAFTGISSYLKQLKLLFSPDVKAYESVGSFITIGSIFPGTWDWQAFWQLTAFISIILAIMNLLPIPALDGGHVIFTLYEMITGRKPSDRFLEIAQIIGMLLIFALFALAMWNDITRFIIK
ncbi:MAG: RIP metalloprotease RseP [Bacteroidales bacterium]|jgi:regulator of sigma E protease|nr:RIP metalloprotease RseP [Bacteroidales bacterium]